MAAGGPPPVLGVDACRGGWVGVLLALGRPSVALFAPRAAELVARAGAAAAALTVVGIDIPVGLSAGGPRQADLLAARELGARRSSVFRTPSRAALEAPTHAEANARSRAAGGEGVSAQAYALRTKVLEVDAWLRDRTAGPRVVEVHPELSYAVLTGAPARHPKRTWAGSEERRAALRAAGIELAGDLGEAGERAGPDDVLDAAVAAWSAARVATGAARSLPDPPEELEDGVLAAIWA
ncbi:putative RNase H-like nuclease [Motilibacter peucedani]|uniref:Putative RNase H-like nuclease n=1 Tax=Motilibacter peucedani TaxID=598650 RepID=A0A420XT90_9ACTN|nr:DUF429 domain-containing protein [Motilibacter peucedani]RKS80024.1 putative RNase H-like nuclease [Motilibacter peucedani]